MQSLVFYLTVLLFTQNVTSTQTKVYVISVADNDPNEDRTELSELLQLLAKSRENPIEEAKHDRAVNIKPNNENYCLMDRTTTKIEKIKCLTEIQRNKSDKSFRNPFYREFYTQRPKRKIYSLHNYYGGLLNSKAQPFTDFTRQEFSQDYLDLGDLSRLETKCPHSVCRSDYQRSKDDLNETDEDTDLKEMRRSMKDSDEESSSSESDSSDSSEEERKSVRMNKKRRKPHRFQVVYNEDSSIESEEVKPKKSYSSESEEVVKVSSSDSEESMEKPKKSRDKYAYLQGNKVYDNFRRRLPHFLPKRFHWDEEDIGKLGYYWYGGPRGKYTR